MKDVKRDQNHTPFALFITLLVLQFIEQ